MAMQHQYAFLSRKKNLSKALKYFTSLLEKTKANSKEGRCRLNVLGVEEESRIITGSVKS